MFKFIKTLYFKLRVIYLNKKSGLDFSIIKNTSKAMLNLEPSLLKFRFYPNILIYVSNSEVSPRPSSGSERTKLPNNIITED